jgi:hypothetical protein
MRQISARLSRSSQAQLKALSAVLQVSQAEVIARSLEALERSLGTSEQRLVSMLKKRDAS